MTLMLAAVATVSAKQVNVNLDTDGQDIQLQVAPGDSVVITAAENRTTGYGWMHEDNSDDRGGYEISNDESVPGNAEDGGVGVPGSIVIELQIIDTGDAELILAYVQSWTVDSDMANVDESQIFHISMDSQKQ